MIARPKPRAEVELAWREWEQQRRRSAPSRPARNFGPVIHLEDPARVWYRGQYYEIPPVSYRAGLEAVEIVRRIGELARADTLDGYVDLLTDAIILIRKNVRPHRPTIRQRVAFWLRNPFKNASELEVGDLLSGLLRRRTSPLGQSSDAGRREL
jgi:hypothetical protein